jgi:hypothetical protein
VALGSRSLGESGWEGQRFLTCIGVTGKKLKKRLEDLERRAGSSDGASSGGEKSSSTIKSSTKRTQQQTKAQKPAAAASMKQQVQGHFSPPMHHDNHPDQYLFPTTAYPTERDRSHSPYLPYADSEYPAPPAMPLPSYEAYRLSETYSTEYLTQQQVPVTLPSMTHFSDAIKRESTGYAAEDNLPYMSYNTYLPGVDMSATHPSPYDHMPHVSSSRSPALPHPQHHPSHHHRARDHR